MENKRIFKQTRRAWQAVDKALREVERYSHSVGAADDNRLIPTRSACWNCTGK